MIDCTSAVRRLWNFIELDLPEAERDEMDKHLAFCRRCCGEVEFAEELRVLLKDSAGPELPPDAAVRLGEFIDSIEGE
ncbi:MAG: zf-HC2 domain-containing protein [Acidimicrobiia bacterium]